MDNDSIIIKLTKQIGLILEFMSTKCLVQFVTLSKSFLEIEGSSMISPDLFDRVIYESFQKNKNLASCNLLKLQALSNTTFSSIPLVPSLIIRPRDVLITIIPSVPFLLVDLKRGALTIESCQCCFDPDTATTTTTTMTLFASEENPSNQMISISLSPDREFRLIHQVVEIDDGLLSINSIYCDGCESLKCDTCNNCKLCDGCSRHYCESCTNVTRCESCYRNLCDTCGEGAFETCEKCEKSFCEGCSNQIINTCSRCNRSNCTICCATRFCEICHEWLCEGCDPIMFCEECCRSKCSTCDKILFCEICNKTYCVGCNNIMSCQSCQKKICMECGPIRYCESCSKMQCISCNLTTTFGKSNRTMCKTCKENPIEQ